MTGHPTPESNERRPPGNRRSTDVRRGPEALFHDTPSPVVRTVLFVDLVESVRMMEDNESAVVRRFRELTTTIERDILPRFDGRLIKSLGDGLMIDFSNVPPAIRAAFAIQAKCKESNANLSSSEQLLLRIGGHAGQMLADRNDVFGRGVSLASRMMTLAGPGEIVVSADVRDQLTPFLDAEVEDLGSCYLKHVQEPVRAYRIGPPGPRPVIEPGSSTMPLLRPTVAVIPFRARGCAAEHHVLGEILADEIISSLSLTSELDVISRLSTTVFRGRDLALDELGSLLNATYVMSGGYVVDGKRMRLNVELAETKGGTVVWSRAHDARVDSIVNGKGDVVDRIVSSISESILARELQKSQVQPLPTLASYTLLMSAIALMHRLSKDDFGRAREMLGMLTERSPRQAVPWAWMAKWHVLRVQQGWCDDAKVEGQLALDCTRRALDDDPHCSLALAVDGLVHTNLLKRLDIANERYEIALRVNPNDALAALLKGTLHAFKGEGKVAVEWTRRARRLSPLDPHRYFYDSLGATAALSAGQYTRAIDLAKRSLKANRTHTSTFRALAISQWLSGREDDARATVSELMKLDPSLTIGQYVERNPSGGYETGKIWSSALRSAGVPE